MNNLMFSTCLLFLFACSPRVNYLGESYRPTYELEVFFDEADIERSYKVMGLISGDSVDRIPQNLEKIQEAMEIKAKEKGADAILYLNFGNVLTESNSEQFIIEAKLLKYKR